MGSQESEQSIPIPCVLQRPGPVLTVSPPAAHICSREHRLRAVISLQQQQVQLLDAEPFCSIETWGFSCTTLGYLFPFHCHIKEVEASGQSG